MTVLESCVVDASVGIKLFVEEVDTDKARRFFIEMQAFPESTCFVPDLFYLECANILWKYVKRFNYSPDDAREQFECLRALDLVTIAADAITESALDIALTNSISVYDACYVAVSEYTGTPLITADKKLVQQLHSAAYEIQYLDDLEL